MSKMVATLVFVSSIVSASVVFGSRIPQCTAQNEGQTILIEGGEYGPEVYVCKDGKWVPASLR